MAQRQITISSDGTTMGTIIAIEGVKMENVKSFKLEGDSESPMLELTLVLYTFKDAVAIEASGEIGVSTVEVAVQ